MNAPSFRVGDRIELLQMADDPDPIPPGTTGRIAALTDLGDWWQISVDWDNGRALSLVWPQDRIKLAI